MGCIQESRICYSVVSIGRKKLLLRRLPMRCCAIVDDIDLRVIQAKFIYDLNARGCRGCNMVNAFGLLSPSGVVGSLGREHLHHRSSLSVVRAYKPQRLLESRPAANECPQIALIYSQGLSQRRHADWRVKRSTTVDHS